ncbi:unnamed protein product [Pylaiella littoralis]
MRMAIVLLATLLAVAQPVTGFISQPLSRPSGLSRPAALQHLRRQQQQQQQQQQQRISQSRSCAAGDAEDKGDSWVSSPTQEIPNNPDELLRLEREYYEKAKKRNTRKRQEDIDRLTKLRHNLKDLPMQRQCHRYRWTQTERTFDVEIPMLKACKDEDLFLVVERDQMQVAIKTDESFGAITGVFPGDVDATSCSFRIHSRFNEPYIHLEVVKLTAAGMYEFWHELLQGEEESPTIRFKGETDRYNWKQNAETIELEIPVPDDVTKRKTKLELDPAGARMHLSFNNRPDFEPLEGIFKGLISPLDSVWMLDENDSGKMLALTVKKRRAPHDKTAWWSGVLEGDDKWEPQQQINAESQ